MQRTFCTIFSDTSIVSIPQIIINGILHIQVGGCERFIIAVKHYLSIQPHPFLDYLLVVQNLSIFGYIFSRNIYSALYLLYTLHNKGSPILPIL